MTERSWRRARPAARPPTLPRSANLPFATALLALVLAGCGTPAGPQPLADTAATLGELARRVLAGFERRDADLLESLRLSETEFRARVWPELPASRPERNVPFDYVWTDLDTKSRAYLALLLQSFGGRSFDLVGVEFDGETTTYETFLVHRHSRLVVRDGEGSEQRLALFGSVLETTDGRFKVFSYVAD